MASILKFMLQRTIFANVIMAGLIIGGLISAFTIRQELLPPQEAGKVEITVQLQGATPEDINTAVLQVVENAVRGMDGVKHIDSEAREGIGLVSISLLENANSQQMLNDITSTVNRIDTFPQNAEKPVITLPVEVEKALSLVIYGDQPLKWLRRTAETVRDDLRTGTDTRLGLQKVQLAFPRDQEVSIETSEDLLRQHGLTLEKIAERIQENSVDLSGGTLFTNESDIVIRTSERREWADEFSDVIITQTDKGIPLYLKNIALIKDGFGTSSIECWFNGFPAIQIDIFAVGSETPIAVEKTVKNYLESTAKKKFQGAQVTIFENQAAAYHSRVSLLLNNALIGLLLVMIILGLFLTPHVAFWVMLGIPTSLLGGLLFIPFFGGSINMISLFAFIVTIGVVVDDAIMIGEAIYAQQKRGLPPLEATVKGLQEMGGPVLLATVTTIIAFIPMFFIPGEMGVLFHQIPAVVVAVLLVSLIESLFILGAHISTEHLSHPWMDILASPQQKVNARLTKFIEYRFQPFICSCLQNPELVIAASLSFLLITVGAVTGGLLDFSFTPTIQSDTVIAQATLPYGSPKKESIAISQKLVNMANTVLKENDMESSGIFSLIGTRLEEGEVEVENLAGTHYISVLVALPNEKERTLSGQEFATTWQKVFGDPQGLEALNFTGETNVTGGEPITLEVFHPDPETARKAALSLGGRMRLLAGLTSVDDGVRSGKPELQLRIKDNGLHMGITAEALAKQVRHRYHGAESFRFVRNGNEIRVMVRLYESERGPLNRLADVQIKSPGGALVPLTEIADITQTRSFTSMIRRDGKRIYPVTADIIFGIDDDGVEDIVEDTIVPLVMKDFPGVSIHFAGEEEENDEALESLGKGFLIVLGLIFLLLVFQYNSYIQPLLIMITIPFSCIGAIWGHIFMGYDLSIVSVIGVIAMAGVVVNDSLVLVTTYCRGLTVGLPQQQAIVDAACKRFRPILLTSLTTFFGLIPLLLETSEQAQFLIPAAISISFGLVFGTVVTIVLVPVLLELSHRSRGWRCGLTT
jgi:multidrug efflux pump subunit AcrB